MRQILNKPIEVKEKLKTGAIKLAETVGLTLGPKGHIVLIEREGQNPIVTADGVTVARYVELEDKFESMGVELAKQVSKETDRLVGDGTTTATVLMKGILEQINLDPVQMIDATALKTELARGAEHVIKEIEKKTIPMTIEQVRNVAYISSLDERVAGYIDEVFKKLGPDAVCGFERTSALETTVEVQSGMVTNRGYQHNAFITDGKTAEAKMVDPYILITDKKLDDWTKLEPLLVELVKQGTPRLVIVSDDMSPAVLAKLLVYKNTGKFDTLAIKAPGFGIWRQEYLKDLALYTGGQYFRDDMAAMTIFAPTVAQLGRCKYVKCNIWSAIFIEGPESQKKLLEDRAAELKELNKTDPSELRKKQISNLIGGVGMIYVGGRTESEIDELAYKVQDAINAVKSGFEEGIVPGGGSVLYNIAEEWSHGKISLGEKLLKNALTVPLQTIAANAGIVNLPARPEKTDGFNAVTGEWCDMIKTGIVDPVKATKAAVRNAVSVATQILMAGALIVLKPEEHEKVDENGMPMPR